MSPELIEAATGATRWQQSFDAPMTDVFRVQADVAERVARELGVALATANGGISKPARPATSAPTISTSAAGTRGTSGPRPGSTKRAGCWSRRSPPIPLLRRRTPRWRTCSWCCRSGATSRLTRPIPRARAAALEALRLDSTLASPWAVLGDYNAMYAWNWAEAERNFRRSLALDPNNANTHHWYNG